VTTGSYSLTIKGQSGAITKTTTITLKVVDLSVTLTANPSSGTAPLNDVDLTATVSGSAEGTINYKFDCNVTGSPGSLIPSGGTWDYTYNHIPDNPKTVIDACDYSANGSYTAGVRVDRDVANPAEAIAAITVSVPVKRPPNAKFSCSPSDCSAYSGSSNPTLTLINQSTDPDGEDDIVSCEWRNLDITGHDMTCPSWNILCNYVVQSTLLPPKDYDIELKVTDKAGASNALVKTIHIKTDAIADLRCSLNEAGPWQDCSDFKGIQGEYTYFKDTSTVSEGATFVRTRIWKINGTTFSSGTFPPDPVPTAKVKLPNRSNTIELTIEDNKGREDTTRYTFGAKLPLPEWKEIGP